jgi:hypothetical protein
VATSCKVNTMEYGTRLGETWFNFGSLICSQLFPRLQLEDGLKPIKSIGGEMR